MIGGTASINGHGEVVVGRRGSAVTWRGAESTGLHGGGDSGGNFILASVSEKVDAFLVEYLRANEEACR